MQTNGFFMQDQVHDRVADIMMESRSEASNPEIGGSVIAVLVVVLTVLNVLAVAPPA